MIDAERMLGNLVRDAMGGRRGLRRGRRRRGRRLGSSLLGGAGKGALALGALGVAIAAIEHFSGKQAAGTPAAAGGAPSPPPDLPPLPGTAAGPLPPPPPGTDLSPLSTSTAPSLPPPPPPADLPPVPTTTASSPPPPPGAAAEAGDALLLIRAMIAAANADHELDDEERRRILEAVEDAEASAEDKTFLLQELEQPMDLAALAAAAATPELAKQVYLASCLAIDVDTRAERNYLDRLAARLGLEPDQARQLEGLVGEEEDG